MIKVFDQKGTRKAYRTALGWLKDRGFSYGDYCEKYPIGIIKGKYSVSKWRDLSKEDKKNLDGQIAGDLIEGPVIITIKYTKESIGKEVKNIIKNDMMFDFVEITDQTNFADDLELFFDDACELFLFIEKHFDIAIPDDKFEEIKIFGQVVDYLFEELK